MQPEYKQITPEAQLGGPIALIKDGDSVNVDVNAKVIDLEVSDEELEARKKAFVAPPLKVKRGTLFKYIRSVNTASDGCTTDEA